MLAFHWISNSKINQKSAKQFLSQISANKQWEYKLCVMQNYKVICEVIQHIYVLIYDIYIYVDMYVDIALSIAQLLTILDADADADVDAELSLCLTSLHVGHLLILCKYQIVLR